MDACTRVGHNCRAITRTGWLDSNASTERCMGFWMNIVLEMRVIATSS